jgi:hypothetical protein
MPHCLTLPTASWAQLPPILLLPLLLAVAAARDSAPIAKPSLSQLAGEWADALRVDTDTAPCACNAPQHGESDHPAFTHCYWACGLDAAVASKDTEGIISQPLLHLLGRRFKACAVSLISGDAYQEGAAVMVHSFAPTSATAFCALLHWVCAHIWLRHTHANGTGTSPPATDFPF